MLRKLVQLQRMNGGQQVRGAAGGQPVHRDGRKAADLQRRPARALRRHKGRPHIWRGYGIVATCTGRACGAPATHLKERLPLGACPRSRTLLAGCCVLQRGR